MILLRWIARITGALALLYYLLLIARQHGAFVHDLFGEMRNISILLLFGAAGYLFAWFREKEGGAVMLISGILMGLYFFYRTGPLHSLFALFQGLPFMVPGFIFYYLGQFREREDPAGP